MANIAKNRAGYGYKYADLAKTNDFLAEQGIRYYQYISSEDGADIIYTVPIIDGKELPARRGCKVVNAVLSGKSNPAQEMGSALTYARRYSLWMAFGLATEDDDAASLTRQPDVKEQRPAVTNAQILTEKLMERIKEDGVPEEFVCGLYGRASVSELNEKEMKYLASDAGWTKAKLRFAES